MKIKIRDQSFQLLPQRAALWENKNTLILSDIHLGKAATFRKLGIPIPEGAMQDDLKRMKQLIHDIKAERCVIVGDLIHAKAGLSPTVVNLFSQWLKDVDCKIELVIGNHDRALKKQLPEGWALHLHLEALIEPPFCFCHEPCSHPDYFVWSGHLHPQIAIKGKHDKVVARCFQVCESLAILPAFSSFVGGAFVDNSNCEVYAIANDQVIKVRDFNNK